MLARPNVRALTGPTASALVHAAGRIQASRYSVQEDEQSQAQVGELSADLVVDGNDRGSQAPRWPAALRR